MMTAQLTLSFTAKDAATKLSIRELEEGQSTI